MRIGIDIDGVLTKLESYVDEKATSYFGKGIVDSTGQDVDVRYGVSEEECNRFWDDVFFDYIVNCDFKEDSDKITKKLEEDGNTIYIITARKFYPQYGFKDASDMRNYTLESLKAHNINYSEYHEADAPKVGKIEELGIDVMIDDEPNNIIPLAKVTKVIIFDASYNRHINIENTYRAHSWNEVYEIISKIKDE